MILIIINQNEKTIDGDNKLTGDTGKVGTQTHCNEEEKEKEKEGTADGKNSLTV